jgi:hypothetical protein
VNDKQWDKQVVDFLKKTGQDLKRTGEEIRAEAQRLIEEVRDPEVQQRLRGKLGEFGGWAKKAAEDAAGMIDTAVKKAESAVGFGGTTKTDTTPNVATPSASVPKTRKASAAGATKTTATKTIGRKAAGGSRKPGVGSARKPAGKTSKKK